MYTYRLVHSSFIQNSPYVAFQLAIYWKIDKLWYIRIFRCYSAIKRNEQPIHATTWDESQKHYAERKKLDIKEYVIYDSTYATF